MNTLTHTLAAIIVQETLDYVYKEINSLWQTYVQSPIFGVECDVQSVGQGEQGSSLRIRSQ